MPELPEVETVKTTLLPLVQNRVIKHVHVYYEPMIKNIESDTFKSVLQFNTIKNMSRRGKYLIFELELGYLLSHLRMEGKYFVENKEVKPRKHTHVVFELDNDMQLFYEDTRKFGTFHYFDTLEDLHNSKEFSVLGVEPNSTEFTVAHLKQHIIKRKKPIKSLLLDQTAVVGLGNIYVDEVLFASGVHPLTLANQLSDDCIEKIHEHTNRILSEAIKYKGTTIKTFSAQHGSGSFQDQLRVHQRANECCQTCQTPIQKIKVGGRGTYFCEKCQPISEES